MHPLNVWATGPLPAFHDALHDGPDHAPDQASDGASDGASDQARDPALHDRSGSSRSSGSIASAMSSASARSNASAISTLARLSRSSSGSRMPPGGPRHVAPHASTAPRRSGVGAPSLVVQSPGEAATSAAVQRFSAIVDSETDMRASHPEVRKAVLAHAIGVGAGAALAFGMGRSIGSAVADVLVRAALQSPQLLGVGEDKAYAKEQSDTQTHTMLALNVARWVGAAIGGGIGSSVGTVLAPRAAAWLGWRLAPIDPKALVPDHVADLMRPITAASTSDIAARLEPYGERGVAELRAEVAALQRQFGDLGGPSYVQAGTACFGVENAARGLGQGLQSFGPLPDIAVSTSVSATAGASTGAFAALAMVRLRLDLPDARHLGDGPAQLISVPLFELARPAPVPDRFTGPSAWATAANLVRGTAHRVGRMAASTLPLGVMSLGGTAVASLLPRTPGDMAHRVIQGGVLGAGVATAVPPWFKAQKEIAERDAARRQPPVMPGAADLEGGQPA